MEGKSRETKGEAVDVQHSWTAWSRQPFPNEGEHRASLLLLRLPRLTNHPDVPKQQLPAITSSRTHVPISCTPISSSVLDLGQISALGCSRVRLLPLRSWRLEGASPGCRPGGLGSPLPLLLPLLPAAGGCRDSSSQHRAPWILPWVGDLSQRETPGAANTGEQQHLLLSYASCQAIKIKSLNSVLAEGSVRGMGDLVTTGSLRKARPGSSAWFSDISLHPVFRRLVSPARLQTKPLALAADEVSAGLPASICH